MTDDKSRPYAVAILDDVFFASKIRVAAESAGLRIEFIKGAEGVTDEAFPRAPRAVIVDLANKKINPVGLIGMLKEIDTLSQARIIGYLPHVDTALREDALGAGYDMVVPRSKLSRGLAELLSGFPAAPD